MNLTTAKAFKWASLSLSAIFSIWPSRMLRLLASRTASLASWPVTAMILRMPLAMPDSSVITKPLISPVRFTCLSSREHIITLTKRWCSRPTAELDTCFPPFRVLDVSSDVIDAILQTDNAHRVRICLAENRSKARDLISSFKVKLLAKHIDVTSNPIYTHRFNLREFAQGYLGFVREVETKFGWSDKRSLLVDVVTKYFAQTEVKNVGCSMIVPYWPSSQLRDRQIRHQRSTYEDVRMNIPHHR